MATKKQSPKDIQYLAFEGGGGMGIAYLGAIKALEELDILPISKGRIKGISGTSAGAITALMVALGLDYTYIKRLVLNHAEDFASFFDDTPSLGLIRAVNENNIPNELVIAKTTEKTGFYSALVVVNMPEFVKLLVLSSMYSEDTAVLVSRIQDKHWISLFSEGAFFSGLNVREYFKDLIWRILGAKITATYSKDKASALEKNGVPFKDFFDLTGVDLFLTGTNIAKKRPGFFSVRHTPNFPVSEAVGISMSFPFIFKPVCLSIDIDEKSTNLEKDYYHGLWCDGGVLNNFPLHAFDGVTDPRKIPKDQHLLPLNPHMLGLRVDKDPNSSIVALETNKKPQPSPECWQGSSVNQFSLSSIAGNLLGTFMYPGSVGQIRSAEEKAQTVFIDAGRLSLFNFTPSKEKYHNPIVMAYWDVLKHFDTKAVSRGAKSLDLG